jgi:LCP family protein required for cell wall assembly
MTDDRTEQLVRDAFAEEAARHTDPREVLAAVRGRRPRRSYGMALATAAVVVVVAAVAAFVIPKSFQESASPAASHGSSPFAPQNVLVVGVDSNEYADSIVLARLTETDMDLVSLPRDTWVASAGTKLNQIYVRSGMAALQAAVGELTGVRVDHYAVVDMAGFRDLTTAVGGVEVCLTNATSDRFSGADFPAGKQVLNGDQALAFVRQRHGLPRGDLDRIVRLQTVLHSLAGRLDGVDQLVPVVKKYVQTDPDLDVLALAQHLTSTKSMRFATIPYSDLDFRTPDHGAAIQVDPAQVRQFVTDLPNTPPAGADVGCVN